MNSAKAFFAIIAIAVTSIAQPRWEWIRMAEGVEEDSITGVAVDQNGFVYISGWGYLPKVGGFLVNASSQFRAKFSSSGGFISASSIGASGDSRISLANDGDIIIHSNNDPGLSRVSPALVSRWSKNLGVTYNYPPPPAFTPNGSIIFASSYRNIVLGGLSLGGVDGSVDVMTIKASADGGPLWIKRMGGTGAEITGGAAVDRAGNIYVTGATDSRTVIFGTITTNSPTLERAAGFIAKRDPNGDPLYIRLFGSQPNDRDNEISAIAIAKNDDTVLGGYLNRYSTGNSLTFSGELRRSSPDGRDLWIKQLGRLAIKTIVVDTNDNIFVAGVFYGTITIDGKTFTSKGGADVFAGQFSGSGSLLWGITGGGAFEDGVGQIALGPDGALYVAGRVRDGGVFGSIAVDGRGKDDGFIGKIVLSDLSKFPSISVQPKDQSAYIGVGITFAVTVQSESPATYQWYRDGSLLAGETRPALDITSVRPTDDATYFVEIRNQYGVVRSESAKLIVRGAAPVLVTTLAGTNSIGFVDSSIPRNSRFNGPDSLAVMGDGLIVIPDTGNNAIRVLEPNGAVGTWAGKGPNSAGLSNGPAISATFNLPIGVCINPAWDIFVADGFNHVIRRLSGFGARFVSTYAGTGEEGFADGSAAQAKFAFPNDLVSDNAGNLYVTEFRGHRVRRISTDGVVTTFAGTGEKGHRDGPGNQALFNEPAGIARDSAGNLYVTCWGSETIRKISPGGVVSTIAGSVGQRGFVDGPALSRARLGAPNGIAVDNKGNIFFTEYVNNSVRRIDPLGDVLTLVGTAGPGFKDGGRADAQMLRPGGVAVHPDGSLIVADTENHAIRKVIWQTNAAPTEAAVLIELNPSITIFGIPGKTYRVEATENLVTGPWVAVGEATLVSSVETWFDTQPVGRRQRYYRAVEK